jgi:hypothetical protein
MILLQLLMIYRMLKPPKIMTQDIRQIRWYNLHQDRRQRQDRTRRSSPLRLSVNPSWLHAAQLLHTIQPTTQVQVLPRLSRPRGEMRQLRQTLSLHLITWLETLHHRLRFSSDHIPGCNLVFVNPRYRWYCSLWLLYFIRRTSMFN